MLFLKSIRNVFRCRLGYLKAQSHVQNDVGLEPVNLVNARRLKSCQRPDCGSKFSDSALEAEVLLMLTLNFTILWTSLPPLNVYHSLHISPSFDFFSFFFSGSAQIQGAFF